MKASDFKKFIEKAKKVVPKRTTVRAFELCWFDAGWLTVRNDEVQVQISVPESANVERSFCFTFYEFETIISKLKNEEIDLIIKEKEIIIESAKGSFFIELVPAEQFDFLNCKGEALKVDTYTESDIAEIQKSVNYASTDLLKPHMMQLHFEKGRIIATDGYFIRFKQREINNENEVYDVPLCVAELIDGGLGDVWCSPENIQIVSPGLIITSKGKKPKFPTNWELVIPNPENTVTTIEVKASDLKSVLDYASISANQAVKAISLEVSGLGSSKEVVFKAEDLDFKRKYERKINVKGGGEEIRIGYKIPFLEHFLKTEKPEIIRFDFETPERATILNGYILLMPCMLDA